HTDRATCPPHRSACAAHGRRQRPKMSDIEGLGERRKRAGKLIERGATQADVARELDVSRESARRWYEVYQRGGAKALATIGQRGRRSRLSDSELARVEKALLK